MLITVTPVAVEPVTLEQAKAHLRLQHDSDDALIAATISAAREHAEQHTGRALAVATYRYVVEDCAVMPLRLPLWPAGSIAAAAYYDSSGTQQALEGAVLDVDLGLVRADDPGPYSRLSIEFTTAPGPIPPALHAAILLLVGDLYENAEANIVGASVAVNPTVAALMFPHRLNLGV